jgi:hypothetical protein
MLCHVDLVRTDVSKEGIASIIRVARIDEVGTTSAFTSNRSTLQRSKEICICVLYADIYLGILIKHPAGRTDVSEERRFLQEPHGVTPQKTVFFIVNAVKPQILQV